MPTSSSWPRTYLNWKRVLLLSLKCVYFMLVVKFSQKCLAMSVKSRLVQGRRQSVQEGSQRRGVALT
ncbi:uncharacterized protein LOC119547976 [Drosophila subpulchrella]|uniref:uncharacterized protein LOC119547976 n=1 Tax=Drosophila subpulchrella TaxID=1486046 RepID=UPI0018A16CD9|nr:uncharacterized protein LOC119547976 [Drosophila subpulchrella]